MKKITLAIAMSLGLANSAIAELYVGGKIGYNNLSHVCTTSIAGHYCDDSGFAISMHQGYIFNKYISAEYGIDYLGDFTGIYNKSGGTHVIKGDLYGITLAPKFNLPINDKLQAFGKLGGAYVLAGSESGFVPTASVGLEYHVDYNISLRAEYQRYEKISDKIIQDMDANYVGFGFNYRFGEKPAETMYVDQPVMKEEVAETTTKARIVEQLYPAQTESVLFAFDSATLASDIETRLAGMIELLNTYSQATAEINGYSDNIGAVKYNYTLSEKRAKAVSEYIVSKGINTDRITTKGLADKNPVASNETKEGRQANRRVEIVIPAFQY